MAGNEQPQPRYSAFLSYSQGDARFVRRLHRKLEGYRLPSRLVAQSTQDGRRLKPVFRDSDELGAAPDLTQAVREALKESEHLIVICSPRSAKSMWVGREIELFRHLHGERGIVTALIEGDPETSFHPTLRHRSHGHATEPLAADFRPGGGGAHLAFLKLVAPLAGVRLADLIHRDAQRRTRQVMAGSGAAVAATALVATLAVIAIDARTEAQAQRNRAGGLNEFMLSDLRRKLQAAGRTDLLADVDKAALQAFPGENLKRLSPEQLEQRAKGQHALGEDSEKRGDLATARAQFEAAWRATAILLAAKPTDAKRIFAHAQSEYWVGFIDWREGDGPRARRHFEAYAHLAARLVASDPKNDDYVMETVYAANTLGALAMRHDGDPALAERNFRVALADIDVIAKRKPADHDVLSEKADALAWLADSQRLEGHLAEAAATREAQGRILADLVARDPRNVEDRADMLAHDLAVARIKVTQGLYSRAAADLEVGRRASLALAAQDPDNKSLARQARMFELFKVRTWLSMPSSGRPTSTQIEKALGDCAPTGPGPTAQEVSDFCSVLLARVHAQAGDWAGAMRVQAAVQQHLGAQHDVLTAHFGLNLAEESEPIRLAQAERHR